MRKFDFVGNVLIAIGYLAMAGALLACLWPLGVGIAAVLVASRLGSFLNDKKEVVAEQIMQISAQLRSKPRTANG